MTHFIGNILLTARQLRTEHVSLQSVCLCVLGDISVRQFWRLVNAFGDEACCFIYLEPRKLLVKKAIVHCVTEKVD